MSENIWILPFHQLNVIFSQLERGLLEIHVARTARDHKAEIDVDDMPLRVD